MTEEKSLHSVCAWTFHAGGGGFTPADIRPAWSGERLDTVGKIALIRDRIAPRLPRDIQLGMEMHYDYEFDERNAARVADALVDAGVYLAMTTPGAHRHWAYGGAASLDPAERKAAEAYARTTLELTYGPLKKAWHPDPALAPCLVIWNGSFGYDLASVGVREMYRNLKESIARLCEFEAGLGGELYIGIEPKPNEGHPAMLLPTVASALLLWRRIEEEYGVDRKRKGVNKEFGHSEMIGLDHVYDTVEELDNDALVHMHINSQGYNDGIILGGPGKYDIDHGARINGMNIAVASLIREGGFRRWKGHDMQPRAYDDEEQAANRVVRSILSWTACERASREIDTGELLGRLRKRDTAGAEDLIRGAVVRAHLLFDEMYR